VKQAVEGTWGVETNVAFTGWGLGNSDSTFGIRIAAQLRDRSGAAVAPAGSGVPVELTMAVDLGGRSTVLAAPRPALWRTATPYLSVSDCLATGDVRIQIQS